ncbi:MAG: MotA/TolQ/ExbB proton channel family protein [Puniceicoccales bacterium]|jgi:biopolymer transport protein TolQ|nr:MotA/TolQ/ExbB proton channel family protein [Puniceicoccales bacterium]
MPPHIHAIEAVHAALATLPTQNALLAEAAHAATKPPQWFFEQCDTFGQGITILLVICSMISIGTMLQKFLELGTLRRRNSGFEQKLRGVDSILGVTILRNTADPAPYEYLAAEAGAAFQKHRGKVLTAARIALCMGHVENAIGRGIARQTFRYERKLILLTSLVSGGPFLGLLGTVYGVMVAFGGLSDRATIAQLAPGVAGALVTTTCGLLVAIPATFGYNYLITKCKLMTTELENYASSLADRIELELQDMLTRAEAEACGAPPAIERPAHFAAPARLQRTPAAAPPPPFAAAQHAGTDPRQAAQPWGRQMPEPWPEAYPASPAGEPPVHDGVADFAPFDPQAAPVDTFGNPDDVFSNPLPPAPQEDDGLEPPPGR